MLILIVSGGSSRADLIVRFVVQPTFDGGRQDVSFGRHEVRSPKQRLGAGGAQRVSKIILAGTGENYRIAVLIVTFARNRSQLEIHQSIMTYVDNHAGAAA